MKSIFYTAAVIAVVVVGSLLVVQGRNQNHRAERLKAELQAKEQEVAEARAAEERARKQVQNLAKASDEVMSQALAREAELKKAVAVSGSGSSQGATAEAQGGFGKMMGAMLNDPEMKQVIAEQQRMMVGQLYGPLIKKLGLSEEESDKFKELLVTNMAGATELAASMFGGDKSNRAELAEKMAAESKTMEDRIKDFLGEDRYAEYKDYQQTVGERAQLNMFRQTTAGSGEPLSEDQSERLLVLMRDAKAQAAASFGQSFPDGTRGQLPTAMSDEQIGRLVSMQEQVNQTVFNGAGGILSGSQLTAFGKYQTNQLQMLKMGLNMARKFMGPQAEQGAQ